MLKRLCAFAAMLSVFAFAQALGNYTGTWTGASGSGGKIKLTFNGEGLQTASFTLQDQEVKAKPGSFKANGQTVTFTFDYEVDGNPLQSRMQGTITGKTLKGKYESVPAGGGAAVDEGTWEVTQQ